MNDLQEVTGRPDSSWLAPLILVVAGLLVIAGLTAANYRFSAANAGGNDFVPRWLGTRLLLLEGQNPYGDETSLAIQRFIYGRPAEAGQDQVLFVYPLYSALFFAPFALIGDYVLARAVWMTTLEFALLLMAFISFRLAGWRPGLPMLALTLLFVLTWYHGARPLINGNASILMASFIAAGLLAIKAERDLLAGPFLALATIKPQAVILVLPLLLIWAAGQRRFGLLASTVASVAALVLLATLIEPAWLPQNLAQITAYPDYTLAGTPGAIFEQWWPAAGRWPGLTLTLIIVALLIWQWRLAWQSPFEVLLPVIFFTMAATNLVGVTTAVSNYIALFPGLILLLAFLRRGDGPMAGWPALLLLVLLLVGLWLLFWYTRAGLAQSPVMFFPLPMLLLLTMPIIARATRESYRSNRPKEFLST
jgi:hypothetical protein